MLRRLRKLLRLVDDDYHRMETRALARTTQCVITWAMVYEDVQRAADSLRGGSVVLIDFRDTDATETVRILTFLEGAIYALGGAVERFDDHSYRFAPARVDVRSTPPSDGPVQVHVEHALAG